MSLAINNNLMAANVANTINSHYGPLSTSVRRLSSGLRVNSAADDAAGLAIRELMRAEIAALNQGVRNVNDAISMLQVADGALAIIDEKLIRMKELAEQAATGTYDSTQRLMIDSEFRAMAAEIDRIANATDFNGIKLLDGSLSGAHDGSGLNPRGRMKIHFGTANASAEDYYYVEIGDCTLAGMGLGGIETGGTGDAGNIDEDRGEIRSLKEFLADTDSLNINSGGTIGNIIAGDGGDLTAVVTSEGYWYDVRNTGYTDFVLKSVLIIPKGSRNIVINAWGCGENGDGDNDLQLFTRNGIHLAGTPLTDKTWSYTGTHNGDTSPAIENNSERLGFTRDQYDDRYLNNGPFDYDDTGLNLEFTNYNGTVIGFSGDRDQHDSSPQDGIPNGGDDYEVLYIREAKEDLVLYYEGLANGGVKFYWDLVPTADPPFIPPTEPHYERKEEIAPIDITTQEKAQKALVHIDKAIVSKDKIRAHLGALQNRFENTVSSLTMQAENLQAAESRISDADIAAEMTSFVKNQILTQSAVAMLSQANSLPQMAMQLLGA